jgi:acetyl-CoA synthetase
LLLEQKSSQGVLCIQKTWPGMARTIYGDHERFINTYLRPYPGYYFSGDGALTDDEGYFQITGRVDDVINVSGHRIGTAEIEDALVNINMKYFFQKVQVCTFQFII